MWENEKIRLPSVDVNPRLQYHFANSSVKTLNNFGQFIVNEAVKFSETLINKLKEKVSEVVFCTYHG